jgi:hypothetical protein
VDAISSAYCSIAESLGKEGLTHTHWTDKDHMLMTIKEIQGKGSIQEAPIHGYLSCPVEVRRERQISSNPAFWRWISRLRLSRLVISSESNIWRRVA